MGFYDSFGQGARDKLKDEYNAGYIKRDIESAEGDIKEIRVFIEKAKEQLAVIEKTAFVTQVRVERRSYKHIDYYVSSEQIPQVPGGEHHKIYPHDDSKKFSGKEKKAVIGYALELQAKYGGCAIVGSGAELIKKPKAVIELGE